MPTAIFGICSKCLQCGTEFDVTLGGKPILCETLGQAQTIAIYLKEHITNPSGIRQTLRSAMRELPALLGGDIFEHLTCLECQAVHERTDLDYWVVER